MNGAFDSLTDLDVYDRAIVRAWYDAFTMQRRPRIGDFVDFPDDVTHRIAHVWNLEDGLSYQTATGGSFYFGHGTCSFSGSLHPALPAHWLTLTGDARQGRVWTFRRDCPRAYNGVSFTLPFRVYACTRASTDTCDARHAPAYGTLGEGV